MVRINPDSIRAVGRTLRTNFQNGIGEVKASWEKFATKVQSTGSRETYAWLADLPYFRKWVGERHVKRVSEKAYEIINDDYEATIAINRNKFEDNELGTYGALAGMYGRNAGKLQDQLSYRALMAGFTTECYDGQNFFDDEHPVGDETVSNFTDGAEQPWFLVCSNEGILPVILQERKPADMVFLGNPDDPNVFDRNELKWGSHARYGAGFSFWQLAFASKQPLTAENYEAARKAIMQLKDDEGEPLGLVPDLLIIGPSNDGAARRLLVNDKNAAGADNEWQGTAEILLSSRVVE